MSSDLSLEFLHVVEKAAIACAHTMGQGDGHKADQAAVTAMRMNWGGPPVPCRAMAPPMAWSRGSKPGRSR